VLEANEKTGQAQFGIARGKLKGSTINCRWHIREQPTIRPSAPGDFEPPTVVEGRSSPMRLRWWVGLFLRLS
jgi:hypothetical protein